MPAKQATMDNENPLTQAAAKLRAAREAKKAKKSDKVGTSGTSTSSNWNSTDVADVILPPSLRGKDRVGLANDKQGANSAHNVNARTSRRIRKLGVIEEENEILEPNPKMSLANDNRETNSAHTTRTSRRIRKLAVIDEDTESGSVDEDQMPYTVQYAILSDRNATLPPSDNEPSKKGSRKQGSNTRSRGEGSVHSEDEAPAKKHRAQVALEAKTRVTTKAVPVAKPRARQQTPIQWQNPYSTDGSAKGTGTIPKDKAGDPKLAVEAHTQKKSKRKASVVESDAESQVKHARGLDGKRGSAAKGKTNDVAQAASGSGARSQLKDSSNKRKAVEVQSDEEVSVKHNRRRKKQFTAGSHDENKAPSGVRTKVKSTDTAAGRQENTTSTQHRANVRETRLQKQLEEAEAKVRELTTLNNKLAASSKPTTNNSDDEIVPHPGGSAGDGYSLQVNMGLEHDKPFYNAIRRTVRELAIKAGVDFDVPYSRNSVATLAKIFKVARNRHTYLQRFDKDWATAAMLQGFIKGHRVYRNRLARRRAENEQDEEEEVAAEVASGSQEDDDEEAGNDGRLVEEDGEQDDINDVEDEVDQSDED